MISFQGLPSLDMGNGVWRAWWMEPLVATLSFMAAIHFYWYHERKRGLSRDNDLRAASFDSWNKGHLNQSLIAYWIGIYATRIWVPAKAMPDGIPSNGSEMIHLIAEVVHGIILYDALFFVVHWLMHHVDILRGIHRSHHKTYPKTVEARDVLCHSLVDGSLQVFCNIIVQQRNFAGDPKSRLARVIHNILVTWMLTESHTATPDFVFWRRWFVGIKNHRRHHFGLSKESHESYQQFFGYLDGLRASVQGPKPTD